MERPWLDPENAITAAAFSLIRSAAERLRQRGEHGLATRTLDLAHEVERLAQDLARAKAPEPTPSR